jgi:hypothetical protein
VHVEHWQDAHGRAKDLGVVWELTKCGRIARCVLQGHPLGTEARVLVDAELISTKAFRDPKVLVDETWEWRKAFEGKGWTAR